MIINFIQNICLSFLALFIIFTPLQTINALPANWMSVPKNQSGEQLWDKDSFHKNEDGSIRVFSKFIPNNTTEIKQEILYTMDIKCSNNSFKDIAIGAKEFNKIKNYDLKWQDPDGDELILGVIDQVCAFAH